MPTRRTLLAGAATALTGVTRPARAEPAPLSFTLNWFAQAEYGGFYQALADGLYEQAGVNVTIAQGGPQLNSMQLLLAGRTDLILGGCEQALLAAGHGLPVTAIATTTQTYLAGLMTHPDIHDPHDLRGHPILIGTESRSTFWPWLMRTYGYAPSQAGVDTSNLQPFALNPRAALQTLVTSEPYAAKKQGLAFNYFLLADLGYPAYGNMILASQRIVTERRDAVAAFLRATGEGWQRYVWGDGRRGDSAILAANPSMTQGQIDFSRETLRRIKAFGPSGSVLGGMTEDRWTTIHETLVSSGAMADTPDWKKAYTMAFQSALVARVP
ncbi:nitrate/sulfonate/bicarbonate ABC transporter substrate-binding periplasmic protein [Ameyamaea chiangmaiensis NBRC 103196]|uniref:ABC transporter substrate-binding protein n=1 Tax=Ameyamaea chiangmaiensis TaxID=442969 RepID=A0A850P877_9PROT|nr:ABC transporter substrate-binding protein [Ameyamaea chiangmaiensis]MBS4073811.1 ABC transporter substrate-binding protein [Ameyamaea chiangmaiensis]NVN39193.1 ABC transporter substrate-binding protein [Ameyamaea chiangmaiensis]GBQ68341.1 nitrate/sulfonate/bicarbonate ABC transporter substrate-binding periplasmic protein [Ameyamaea chiangmaiensis NBRC 103196]